MDGSHFPLKRKQVMLECVQGTSYVPPLHACLAATQDSQPQFCVHDKVLALISLRGAQIALGKIR